MTTKAEEKKEVVKDEKPSRNIPVAEMAIAGIVGATGGAMLGAAIGTLVGRPDTGQAIGTLGGAVGGATYVWFSQPDEE